MRYLRNKNKIFLTFLVLFLILIYFWIDLRSFVSKISTVLWTSSKDVETSILEFSDTKIDSLRSKGDLIIELKEKRSEVERLKHIEEMYQNLFEKNKKLQELLGLKPDELNVELSRVVSNSRQSVYGTFLIRGNFLNNSLVLSEGGLPLGVIERNTNKYSLVKMFSSSGEKTEINMTDGTPAILIGRGGGNFKINLLREAKVFVGDKVFMSGINEPIAQIDYIDFDPRDPYQTIYLSGIQNIFKIDYVWVKSQTE